MDIRKCFLVTLIPCFLAVTSGCQSNKTPKPRTNASRPVNETNSLQVDPFKKAIDKAIQSANLVQSAKTNEEWEKVSNSWQQSIDFMKAVPESNPNYAVAQQKVIEYQPNLEYARKKAESSPTANDYYNLSVVGKDLGDGRVQIDVKTNIPGVIEIAVSIDLANQEPTDIYIGTGTKLTLQNGSAQTILGVNELPKGNYEVEASFYPKWGFKDALSKQTGISANIESVFPLVLDGSGESVDSAKKRNDGQVWVMSNVNSGQKWDPSDWVNKYGSWQEIPLANSSRNPEIIKNYYFSSIDMTIVVNVLKQEVVTFRLGREGL
jgi:hypothetical protein